MRHDTMSVVLCFKKTMDNMRVSTLHTKKIRTDIDVTVIRNSNTRSFYFYFVI